jgi:hypothetical protein
LPYWNYTGSERAFPRLFGDAEANPQGEPTNPLFEGRRELLFVFGLYELADGVVTTEQIFSEPRFFGETESEGFAGGVGDTDGSTRGLIERQPHDLMHVAVGGVIGDDTGLMSFVPTAAFDPVFWVHHTNIDRLWSQWETLPDRTWGFVPALEWFHAQPWFFNDSDGSVKNLPRYHYLKFRDLGVTYDDDDLTKPRLSDKLPPGVGTPEAQFAGTVVLSETTSSKELSATEPVTLKLRGAAPSKEGVKGLVGEKPPAKRRVVVELTYSAPQFAPNVGFDVFLVPTVADKVPLQRGLSHHIGILNLFGTKHGHGGHADQHGRREARVQMFDITKLVANQALEPREASIVVKPFDLFKSTKPGVPVVRRAGGIVVNDVQIRLQ